MIYAGLLAPAQAEQLEPHRAALRPDVANPPMLFNLREDPGETVDRSAEFPERVAALEARAQALFAELQVGRLSLVSPPGARSPRED